ncbi:class I SAM-dependent methyltransferase [Candidatus Nitrospira neomarina]|uniref:Class I SAM-dependent methyltransferase n=1 Tax=Candidatus Nitrospira neomarina TaxID=3020899 RepID=A0AA96GP88_9BACT|nr:class I SAM-dependent methyltransferase [Candidatus Nitrospira neomarina]WNM64075.1 class I SAM-dependent methyltransferase [Candidatus Nitrospira neomarina]
MTQFIHILARTPFLGRFVIFLFRIKIASTYLLGELNKVLRWLYGSRETTNLTYDLTELNKKHLVSFLANVTQKSFDELMGYVNEIEQDTHLKSHIENQTAKSSWSIIADKEARYGRRVGWYALIRAFRPQVVIETGIDKGLGSCVITAALMKNCKEGLPGFYYGTDINPKAGYLLSGEYKKYGEILIGDSIESLNTFSKPIDLFINDSAHSAEYELREYHTIQNKLTQNAFILGDNSHCTDKLFQFSRMTGRNYLFFQEVPKDHWYPGAGIGVAFKAF